MNSYSIRFTHWLFRVRNDTVKHRHSCDIYFKGCITNNFLITILFLLRLLLYCSLTFFPKQIARCKSSTYSDRCQTNWMLLAGPPEFLSLFVPQTFLSLFALADMTTQQNLSHAAFEGRVLSDRGCTNAGHELLSKVRCGAAAHSIWGWLETISVWVCM